MNWLCSLIVFQYTILLLHGRPETSSTSLPEKITLEMEHPSSVAAIITSLGSEPSAGIVSADTKKHLSATVAVSPPSQTTKRVLSTAHVKRVEPTKKAESVTFSSATINTDAISKTTRYHDVDNRTKEIMHAKQLTANHSNRNYNKAHHQPLLLNNTSNLRELKQQYVNRLNRQYLGNVYSYNPYLAQVLTTPKTIQTIVASAPPPQQTYFIVNPDEIGSMDSYQTNGNFGNLGNFGNILNIENPLSSNFDGTFSTSETYQVPRPPPPLTVNIPYHEFPPQSRPFLVNSANITKLYSIIGSSTPDPYDNYEEVQTKPSLIRKKVVKFSVTTHRPYKYNHKHGNHQHNQKYPNKSGENVSNDKFIEHNNDNKHGLGSEHLDNNHRISIVYNASSQIINVNNKNTNDLTKSRNESLSQQPQKECVVTPSSGNTQNENVCNSNDLKIIIKFDGNSIANATKKNEVKSKPKKKKLTTTTTTTTPAPYYDDLSYESDETKEESDELANFFEPIQNIFGFAPATRAQRRRRRKRPNKNKDKDKKGHKDKSGEIVNKYQTIILQTPSPPTTTERPSKKDKSLFYKFLALIPILTVLKPLGFGLWTLILSPLLVITIGGVALGVILYPFLAISRKQIYFASTQRSPRIVIHKHPRPIYSKVIQSKPSISSGLGPGYTLAKWTAPERRRSSISRDTNTNTRRMFYNNNQQKRIIPIRIRKLQERSKRRARDTQFQQWLLIQNNFNIRIMSPNQDYDY